MGWWSTPREGDSFTSDKEEYVWGDGPADIFDDALDKVAEQFEEAFGRQPRLGELRAGLEFSLCKDPDEMTYREMREGARLSDVETLAKVLAENCPRHVTGYCYRDSDQARALLASDWLAAHDEQVRREALTEALHPEFGYAWREPMPTPDGGTDGGGVIWQAIQEARAEERERIAQAIETRGYVGASGNAYGQGYCDGHRDGREEAARIARQEQGS